MPTSKRARAHPLQPLELPVKVGVVPEAYPQAHFQNAQVGFGKKSASLADSTFIDVGRDRTAGRALEEAAQRRGVEVGDAGDVLVPDLVAEVPFEVGDDRIDSPLFAPLVARRRPKA